MQANSKEKVKTRKEMVKTGEEIAKNREKNQGKPGDA